MTLLLLLACTKPGPETDPLAALWHQPLALDRSNHAGDVDDLADPHPLYVDGTWYLFPTHSKRDLEVWTSTDLVTWAWGGVVWEPTPGTWNDDGEVWAPSIHPGDGGWYMYYTAGLRIGVAWSAEPGGPYEDVLDEPLVGGGHGGVGDGVDANPTDFIDPLNFEEFSIDAFLLDGDAMEDPARFGMDGRKLLFCTSYSTLSRLVAVELSSFTTTAAAAPTVVLAPESDTWEGFVNEGPWIVENDGELHLMYSGNDARTERYGMGVAVANDPLGPYTRYADNPLLAEHADADVWGPGHHGLAPGPDGRTLIFYHAKNTPEAAWNRHLRVATVEWGEAGMRIAPPLP